MTTIYDASDRHHAPVDVDEVDLLASVAPAERGVSLLKLLNRRARYLTDDQTFQLEATAGRGWQDDALCAQGDPEAWFPDKGRFTPPTAYAMCAECPVQRACLAAALLRGEKGTWAGTTERDRRVLASSLKAGVPVVDVLDRGLGFNPQTERVWDGAA